MAPFPQRLLDGYRTFATQRLPTEQSRYRELSEQGQSPAVMLIGCCDSRVSPEVIFDAGPGELFVVRNVANLVPPFETDTGFHGVSAGIEFATLALEVKDIVICGHSHCGAVRALYQPARNDAPHMNKWLDLARPAMVMDPMSETTLRRLVERHRETGAAATLLTAELDDPSGYGRVVREAGRPAAIVEHRDATPEQPAIPQTMPTM